MYLTHPHNAKKEHEVDYQNGTGWPLEYPVDGRLPHPSTLDVQLVAKGNKNYNNRSICYLQNSIIFIPSCE